MKQHLLAKAEAAENFRAFRKGIDRVILEITNALRNREGDSDEEISASSEGFKEKHVSRVESSTGSEAGTYLPRTITTASVAQIGARLKQEVQHSPTSTNFFSTSNGTRRSSSQPNSDRMSSLNDFKKAWTIYSKNQTESIITLIKSGALGLEDILQIEVGAPSLQSVYSDRLPKAWTSSLVASTSLARVRANTIKQPTQPVVNEDMPCSEALTKSFSLLFGLKQLTDELSQLHEIILAPRRRKIRIRILERFWTKDESPPAITLQAALSGLKGQEHHTPSISIFRRLIKLESELRSDSSLYAAKVALAATVYLVFLLSPDLQSFFLQFGLSSSLITVIVAISPIRTSRLLVKSVDADQLRSFTVGQTLFTFALQLSGVGVGNLYGLLLLEIFRQSNNSYSRVGLTFGLSLWGFLTSCIFYYSPKYYSLGLLAMNGAGTLVANEVLHLNNGIAYGSPGLRAGMYY